MAILPTAYFNEFMMSEDTSEFKRIVEYANHVSNLLVGDAVSYFDVDPNDKDLDAVLLLQDYFYEHTGVMFIDDLKSDVAACFYVQRLIENDEIDLLVQNPIALQLVMIDFLGKEADEYPLTLFAQHAATLQGQYFYAYDMSYLQHFEDFDDEDTDSDDEPCPCGGSWCQDSIDTDNNENDAEEGSNEESADGGALLAAVHEELAKELLGFMEDLGYFKHDNESQDNEWTSEESPESVVQQILGGVKELSENEELLEDVLGECGCDWDTLYSELDDDAKVRTFTIRIS